MTTRKGKDIVLYWGTSQADLAPFAYSKSCEYSMKRDMKEVASPTSGGCKEFIPGRYEWEMSCSCLLSDDNGGLIDALKNKTKLHIMWRDDTDDEANCEVLQGRAYISSLKAGASIHQMATFSISLRGTGDITRT